VKSLDPKISAAKFVSTCRVIIIEIKGASFVDDSSLCVTSEYIYDPNLTGDANRNREADHLVSRLAQLSQLWERLLFTTGGGINYQKSHWYLMTWLWKNGIPCLATISQSPVYMMLTTGTDPLQEMVPCKEPTDGFQMLGVYLTPAGQYKKQVKILRAHAEMFKDQLMSSSLSQLEAYCCYMIYIRPKISYPLPCVSLTEQQCRHIQAPIQ
jgi:hypothetical protein